MKKTAKTIGALLLALTIVFSALSCVSSAGLMSIGTRNTVKLDTSELTAWTLNSAEKTKQIMTPDTSSTTLDVKMAKGETEGAQVMLTAKKDVVVKSVKVSKLKNGYAQIPSENVEIFYSYYVELKNEWNGIEEFNVGDKVSDAIFPFDTCVEYGMNTVERGRTQSIYIEVTTLANTVPGTYTAEVTVETYRDVYVIPFTVTVWNYDITELTVKTETCITDYRGRFSVGEMDSSDQMATYYFEAGLKYGMNSSLPFDGTGGTERYIELLRKYYNHPHFSSYRLYYETVQGGFNVNLFAEYLVAIGKASVEDNANYFTKAITYFSNICDEPHQQEHFDKLAVICNQLNESIELAVRELKSFYLGTTNYAYIQNVLEPSMRSIENVMPISTEVSIPRCEATAEMSLCPQLNFYNTQAQRDVIDECFDNHEYQTTKWTYTCLYPKAPYPTSHLDDFNLNYRVMSWMLNKYDISAYLMWCVTLNACGEGRNPYDEDARVGEYGYDMSTSCPGDGFMFYPGRPYGIDGPIASLRAVAFRDGLEDYESINVLKSIYEEKGLDSENVLSSLYERILTGTISIADQNTFDEVRTTLGEMITESSGDLGIIYKDIIIEDNNATVEFILASDRATVEFNEKVLTAKDGVYSVVVDLSKQSYIKLKVVNGSKSVEYNKYVAGKYVLVSELDTEAKMSYLSTNKDSTIGLNTDTAFISGSLKASTKLQLTGRVGSSSSFYPFFAINLSDYDVTNISSVGFKVYCDNKDGITFNVSSFTGVAYALIEEIHLDYGWNNVTINVSAAKLTYDKKVYFRTNNLVSFGLPYSVDLYFNNLMLLTKGE